MKKNKSLPHIYATKRWNIALFCEKSSKIKKIVNTIEDLRKFK